MSKTLDTTGFSPVFFAVLFDFLNVNNTHFREKRGTYES
ncbi:hypothetical protein JavanS45_0016 [Streptococcus satellite phage Javan45]|nr:hypothetical protein JavanS45_0016 [Streptococcus satellite phage Javan45]